MAENHEAQVMADFIERWLGNPLAKRALKGLTKRCPRDGRRAERILESYASDKPVRLCSSCRTYSMFVNKLLDNIIKRTRVDESIIKEHMGNSMWRKGLASVLEGIAEFGPQKPFTAYSPFLVVWNITRACNLRCRHCYEVAAKPGPDELDTRGALKAVDDMAEAGLAYIAISGGEPLFRKDIFQIAERIKERGMAFSIATNGTLLNRERARRLRELDCLFVQVSLDGSNPESHNWFRGRDSFERTVIGIKNAVAEGLSVGISTTVTQHNYKEVPDVIDLAEKLGASTFMHYNFIPTGRGKEIMRLELEPEQREDLLIRMARQAGKRKIRVLSTAPQYARVCVENEAATIAMTHFDYTTPETSSSLQFLAEFVGGCGSGRLYCALEPNGDIEPCVFIPIKLGNIKKDDLLEVWLNSTVLKRIRRRERFGGNCGVCEYRNMCGGCRARAYSYFGDVQGPDPGCVRNRKEFEKLKKSVK